MPRHDGVIRPYRSTIGAVQRVTDVLWIVGAHVALARGLGREWSVGQTVSTFVAVLTFQLVGEASGLYRAWRGVPFGPEVARIAVSWGVAVPAVLLTHFLSKTMAELSRGVTLAWFVLAPALITSFRGITRMVLRELRKTGRNTRAVGIVGMTPMGETVARRILAAPELGYRLLGFYEDRAVERCHAIPADVGVHAGSFDDLVEQCRSGTLDIVYMALPLRAEPRVNALLRRLADTTASVYIVPDFFVFDLLHARWSSLGDVPVVSIFETPFYGVDGWLKRIEDIVLGSLALAIAGLPMAIIAVAIKLSSKGPVFFRQRRYGLNGDVIEVLKFRTMRVQEDGPVVTQATKGDVRITPLGRLLRRTSLDELPQLIHVVQGTMSLVGPRPHAVAHNEEYRRRIHGYMLRHKVKPGLTGWAQVNGWRGETDTLEKMERRVEHDLAYIRRWSLLFDLRIVFMTVFSRSVHRNAY